MSKVITQTNDAIGQSCNRPRITEPVRFIFVQILRYLQDQILYYSHLHLWGSLNMNLWCFFRAKKEPSTGQFITTLPILYCFTIGTPYKLRSQKNFPVRCVKKTLVKNWPKLFCIQQRCYSAYLTIWKLVSLTSECLTM